MARVNVYICIILLVCLPLFSTAQSKPIERNVSDVTGELSMISSLYDAWGVCLDLVINGDYAYVIDGYENIRILDIADLTNIEEVGRFDFAVYDIELYNQYLVASHQDTLKIYDISNPVELTEVGEFYSENYSTKYFHIDGSTLYSIDYSTNKLISIDLSDVNNPSHACQVDLESNYSCIDISGNFLFAVEPDSGIGIFDVTDPTDIELSYEYSVPHISSRLITSYNDFTYVVDDSDNLIVIDFSTIESPQISGTFSLEGILSTICFAGNYAYVYSSNTGFQILNVEDPSNILEVSSETENSLPIDSFVFDGQLYLVYRTLGIRILDISTPDDPTEIGSYCGYFNLFNFVIQDDVIYFISENGDESFSIKIVDISDPTSPAELSEIDSLRYITNLKMANNNLYVGTMGAGLIIFDITNPSSPVELNRWNTLENIISLEAKDDYVYFNAMGSDEHHELVILDVSDPEDLEVERLIDSDVDFTTFEISGDYLYILYKSGSSSEFDGIKIYNLQSTPSVNVVNTIVLNDPPLDARTIKVEDDLLYVKCNEVIQVFNIADPYHCIHANDIVIDLLSKDFAINDNFLYYSYEYDIDHNEKIEIIDFSDTTHHYVVSEYEFCGAARYINLNEDYIIISNLKHFSIMELTLESSIDREDSATPGEFGILSTYPNPFNPTLSVTVSLPISGHLKVQVYNVMGQVVGTLVDENQNTGYHQFEFDGSGLASGIYFIKASVPEKFNSVRKVTLLK